MKAMLIKVYYFLICTLKFILVSSIFGSFVILCTFFYFDILASDKVLYNIYILDFKTITDQYLIFYIFIFLFFLFIISNVYRYKLGYFNLNSNNYKEKLKSTSFFSRFKLIIFLQKVYEGLLVSIFVGSLKTEILKNDLVTSKYFESLIIQRIWDVYEKKCYLLDFLEKNPQNMTENLSMAMDNLVQSSFSLKELKLKLEVLVQQGNLITDLKKKVLDYCSDNNLVLENISNLHLQIESLFGRLQQSSISEINSNISALGKLKLKNLESIIQEDINTFNKVYKESQNEIFQVLEEFKNSNITQDLDLGMLQERISANFIVDSSNNLIFYFLDNIGIIVMCSLLGFLTVTSLYYCCFKILLEEFPEINPSLLSRSFNLIYLLYCYSISGYLEDINLAKFEKDLALLKKHPQEFIEFLKNKLNKSILTEDDLKNARITRQELQEFNEFVESLKKEKADNDDDDKKL